MSRLPVVRDAVIGHTRAMIAEFPGIKLTLRQLFYRLVTRQVIENKISANILEDLHVDLVVGRGYNSVTQLKNLADSLRDSEPEKTVFLYFGDYDPTGIDIDRSINEAPELEGIFDEFRRVALTREQVQQ